jgi:hypothetical protein
VTQRHRVQHQFLGAAVTGKGARLTPVDVAAELVEQDEQGEPVGQELLPFAQAPLQGLLDLRAQALANDVVLLGATAKPQFLPIAAGPAQVQAITEPGIKQVLGCGVLGLHGLSLESLLRLATVLTGHA